MQDNSNNDEWGQSRAPILTAMIWRRSGRCSLKAHSQITFKGRHTGEQTANRREESDEKDIVVQKYSCLHLLFRIDASGDWDGRRAADAASESKPRGQPSVIATIIYADTTSTWTTYEDPSPK